VIYPTRTFRDSLKLQIAGLDIELIHSPSETPDNIILWLPGKKVIATGDSLTPTLPPIFTARGQRVRDPDGYLKSLDLMRSLQPEHVIPSHGPAFSGPQAQQVLQNYRDAVAFMYHQTVRLINKGLGPEAIAARLKLPAHLQNNMYLGQWYNDFQTNIRGVYSFLVGHYGDVSEMPLLTPEESDRSMIALAGGPVAYLEKLQQAYDRGDYVFTARAASHLIRTEPHNQPAKNLKAQALRKLAAQTIAGSHRHFYLQHAAGLEGLIDISLRARFTEEDVASVPAATLIKQLPFRLNAEQAAAINSELIVALVDTGEQFRLQVRKGIAEADKLATPVIPDISLNSKDMRLFYIGQKSITAAAKGNLKKAIDFFSLFDWPRE
jgi:alkyl sulfatase BDS1-like metallo-beta-lactamase superfamily hydrolase